MVGRAAASGPLVVRLILYFAFTATSFFAGAEKRKQKLRFGASAAEAEPRARRRLPLVSIESLLRRRDQTCAPPPNTGSRLRFR